MNQIDEKSFKSDDLHGLALSGAQTLRRGLPRCGGRPPHHVSCRSARAVGGRDRGDESYFGDHSKGQRGRGAAGRVPVFGLLKRQGKVYVVILQMRVQTRLFRSSATRSSPTAWFISIPSGATMCLMCRSSITCASTTPNCSPLRNHINGIENFWNQAKRHLRSYNGVPRQHFHLFIKECEWRFNYRPIGRMQATLMGWWFK